MFDFENKIVLITGGSRGIGAAAVRMFSSSGAEVCFTYNTNAKAAKNVLRESESRKLIGFKVSATNEKMIDKVVKTILKTFGRIDVLVNNLGIWEYGEADRMSLASWRKTIQTNIDSMFLFSRAVIPSMKENKSGKIINISSTAGQRGEAFHSHYAASKGAMISYTKSLASELGAFNINVNSVAPGWVLTDMSNDVFENKNEETEIINAIPLRRIAAAEDVAGAILFLASEYSRHITGEILNVNGGSVLCG